MTHSVQLIVIAALAAKQSRPGDWSFGWSGVASIAEMALAITVCLWVITTYFSVQRQQSNRSPWRLFSELCSAHKLSRRDRHVLKRLASQHRLEQPALLFVEPSWFSVETVGSQWLRDGEELDRLRQRLFARS